MKQNGYQIVIEAVKSGIHSPKVLRSFDKQKTKMYQIKKDLEGKMTKTFKDAGHDIDVVKKMGRVKGLSLLKKLNPLLHKSVLKHHV